MKNIAFSSIKELKQGLERKEFSTTELIAYFLNRFKHYDTTLGSALELFEADQIEYNAQGILQGIPGLIKDNICISGRSASCASKILQNFVAPYDATVIKRLRSAGATFIGRANMDEFAMGSSTETSAYKKTQNPWDSSRVPGGSSGGSAAAVAAGLIPWSLGSDTGGSIRQPAAFCGIVGMKPTYGLVSRYGLIAYASSLDQIGPMTRTVYDNALILSLIAGNDERDSSTRSGQAVDYTKNLTGNLKSGLRIGVVDNALNAQGMDSEISVALEQVIKSYETLGATIKHITIPAMDYTAAAYFVLSRAEAASNLARFDGVRYGLRSKNSDTLSALYTNTRHDGFGKEVRARIMIGNYVLSAGYANEFYVNAKKVQALMRTQFMQAFNDVDILLMPTHPMPAFKFGAFDVDTLQMDLQDYFTCSMNLAGIPAISLPGGFTKTKLPIGFQLAATHGAEDLLYQTAYAYEQKNPWYMMHPTNF